MSSSGNGHAAQDHHYAWWLIMCLCGVDYFSTLGYQPSIAFEGAGTLAPVATLVLVLVTLLGALPVYCHVAGATPDGVGSVGMIERMFRGWWAKLAVLVLVGFAATDFVITKTLSAADAAAHLVSNSLWTTNTPMWLQSQLPVTMFLLVLLGAMFIKGYGEVVSLATALVIAFTLVNLLVTWVFRADVSAQGGAYATGVLVLMTSAAIGSYADLRRLAALSGERGDLRSRVKRGAFALIALVFIYTTVANIHERPDGIIIASIFIACVLTISLVSRIWRSRELRHKEFRFEDDAARMLWTDILADATFRVFVPHRPGSRSLAEKEAEVRSRHRLPADAALVFLEVHDGDPSDFHNCPILSARQEGERFVIVARDVVSVSHTIARVAIDMSRTGTPLEVVFGWSQGSALR